MVILGDVTMSENPNERHPHRSMDGPVRRVRIAPIAPLNQPEPPEISEPAAEATLPMAKPEPIFEYHKPKKKRRHFVRWAVIAIVLATAIAGGWIGSSVLLAAHHIIAKAGVGAPALKGKVTLAQLKGEGDGRINILVMGIGGAGHDGSNLSDTMMVWSIDPQTKDIAMLSIPRDLYVKIPGHGYGKINAANAYGGPSLSEQVVQTVIGVPIHYYAVLDFSGFKQAVNVVGGVDVTAAKTLSDPLYPCDDGTRNAYKYCPIYFTAGLHHMDGTLALEYARSRETTSDFDRAARQQVVLVALRAKAMELSTLSNPIKLVGLINAVGSHLKTDLQVSDMQKLAGILKDVDPTKITQKVLDAGKPDSLLNDGTNLIPGAGSIELPKAGNFNYTLVQALVKNIFVDHYIVNENAKIEVDNGSGVTGLATTIVTALQAAHYNVLPPTNAGTTYTQTVIYDYTGGKKPYTINYLAHRFGVTAQQAAAPSPAPGIIAPDVRIILGSDSNSNSVGFTN